MSFRIHTEVPASAHSTYAHHPAQKIVTKIGAALPEHDNFEDQKNIPIVEPQAGGNPVPSTVSEAEVIRVPRKKTLQK